MTDFNRRQILKLLVAAPFLPQLTALAQTNATKDALGSVLPKRALGATGQSVTMLGAGGWHIGMQDESDVPGLIDRTIERGVRFFDTAEAYQKGGSERYFGKHLTPKYREHIFLMTKSGAGNAKTARQHLDGSRQRMKTDVIDLWQIHSLESVADVDRRFDNGVIDVFLTAKEKGLVKYIGFTGHSSTKAHIHFLKRLEDIGVEFDTTQMPMNVVDAQYESYITHVLPILIKRNYGVLAMKTLAAGRLLGEDQGWGNPPDPEAVLIPKRLSLAQAFGFVWSQPVSCLISGMQTKPHVQENTQIAWDYLALAEQELANIQATSKGSGGIKMEFYKDGEG